MNLIFEVSLVNFDAKLAMISIAELLITQFNAFNLLIFANIKKPKLKKFFAQTDKLIYQMEIHTHTKIGIHNYCRRISNLKLAAVVASILIQNLMGYPYHWGKMCHTWVDKTFYVVFSISTVYYNLWIYATGLIINCTCMEVYVKLICVLSQSYSKYPKNLAGIYLICNQVCRNLDNFDTIFHTTTLILLSYAFLYSIVSFLVLQLGYSFPYDSFMFLFMWFLVVYALVHNGTYLSQGVSIAILIVYCVLSKKGNTFWEDYTIR